MTFEYRTYPYFFWQDVDETLFMILLVLSKFRVKVDTISEKTYPKIVILLYFFTMIFMILSYSECL